MRRTKWIAIVGVIALCLVVVTALAGCGLTAGHQASGQASSNSATQTAAGGGASGRVTVTLDKPRYASGDTIVVTLHNGLGVSIFAADHQSDCSLVTIERHADTTWQTLGLCHLMTATRLVELKAGSATIVRLPSGNEQFVSSGAVWPSGDYRIVFSYTVGAHEFPTGATAVYVTFTIG